MTLQYFCEVIAPKLSPAQTEAYELVQELYASPRMLLAVLDRALLSQVQLGLRSSCSSVGCIVNQQPQEQALCLLS